RSRESRLVRAARRNILRDLFGEQKGKGVVPKTDPAAGSRKSRNQPRCRQGRGIDYRVVFPFPDFPKKREKAFKFSLSRIPGKNLVKQGVAVKQRLLGAPQQEINGCIREMTVQLFD